MRTHQRRQAAVTPAGPLEYQQEKQEQREVVRLYESLGCEIVSFSQPRATMQTEGIPDLRVYCRRKGLAWWHEVKVPGGTQRPGQKEFQERAQACRERYVLGGWEAAVRAAKEFGLVAPGWRPVRHHA